jgi:hypothetical protein
MPGGSGKGRRLRQTTRTLCTAGLAISLLFSASCRREEKIKLEPTDESTPALVSTVQASDTKAAVQLVRGFHALEQNSWRWTMGRFVVALRPPAGSSDRGATLTLKFTLPQPVIDNVKSTTIRASIQNTPVGSQTYSNPGEQTFTADVPAKLLKGDAATVEFTMDHFLSAGTVDGRELGIVFVSVGLEAK